MGLAAARLFVEDGASAFILGRRQKELDEAVDGIGRDVRVKFENWRGRDGNDPSVDIAKDADQRFYTPLVGVATSIATRGLFSRTQMLAVLV